MKIYHELKGKIRTSITAGELAEGVFLKKDVYSAVMWLECAIMALHPFWDDSISEYDAKIVEKLKDRLDELIKEAFQDAKKKEGNYENNAD